MTLTEALRSGRRFKHAGGSTFAIPPTFTAEDVVATDYVLEPEAKTITVAELASAWDSMSSNFTTVRASATSPLFAALVSELFD